MILMNSPTRSNTGENEGFTRLQSFKFTTKTAFGIAQEKPPRNAETAASRPPIKKDRHAAPSVVKICNRTIFFIFLLRQKPETNHHYGRDYTVSYYQLQEYKILITQGKSPLSFRISHLFLLCLHFKQFRQNGLGSHPADHSWKIQ